MRPALRWLAIVVAASACGKKAIPHNGDAETQGDAALADASTLDASSSEDGAEAADDIGGGAPDSGDDVGCPARPAVAASGTGDPSAIYPTPRVLQAGELFAKVETACIDTHALSSHAHLDALASELVHAAGLTLAAFDCACDYPIAFVPNAPALTSAAGQVLRQAGANAERYVVLTKTSEGRALATAYAANERGGLYALRAALAMVQPDPMVKAVRRVATSTIVDYPAFGRRGIVEAIYGPLRYCDASFMGWLPWRVGQRQAAIDLASRLRENAFIYGPKCDPYARARWRTPYPPGSSDEAVIRVAIHEADRYLVDFVWSISPGGDYNFGSPQADWNALTAKIDAMRKLGVEHFALFLDDIPDHSAGPQVGLINALEDYIHKSAPLEHLIVVGTTYCSDPNNTFNCGGPNAYTDEIGRTAHPDVEIMWTGADVEPSTMSAADMHAINTSLGRKVTIWDNWPNAPGGFSGRSSDLDTAVQGYYSNPVLNEYPGPAHPALTFFEALGPIADYLWMPDRYDGNTAGSYNRWKPIIDRDPEAQNNAACGSYASGWTCDPHDSHRVFYCDITSADQPAKALTEHFCPGGCVSKPVGSPDVCN
jgi:hyaluronoglucosaminidase